MDQMRIADAKSWTSALLASIATAAGGAIAARIQNPSFGLNLLIVAVFPALSTVLVGVVFKVLQDTRRGRRLMAGPQWIEGYWHIVTLDAEHDTQPVASGLMYVNYEGPDNHLSIVVFRTHPMNGRTIVKASESTLATFRESDQHFMNVCMQRYEQSEDKALGVGTFLRDGTKDYPTRYEGWMIRLTEGVYRIQVAERIPDEVIEANQKKFGKDWIAPTIAQGRDLQPSQAINAPESGPALRSGG
jgi:hypothetical protein